MQRKDGHVVYVWATFLRQSINMWDVESTQDSKFLALKYIRSKNHWVRLFLKSLHSNKDSNIKSAILTFEIKERETPVSDYSLSCRQWTVVTTNLRSLLWKKRWENSTPKQIDELLDLNKLTSSLAMQWEREGERERFKSEAAYKP